MDINDFFEQINLHLHDPHDLICKTYPMRQRTLFGLDGTPGRMLCAYYVGFTGESNSAIKIACQKKDGLCGHYNYMSGKRILYTKKLEQASIVTYNDPVPALRAVHHLEQGTPIELGFSDGLSVVGLVNHQLHFPLSHSVDIKGHGDTWCMGAHVDKETWHPESKRISIEDMLAKSPVRSVIVLEEQ